MHKAPFVDSDTRATARVDADVVDFRVCGIQDRVCGKENLGNVNSGRGSAARTGCTDFAHDAHHVAVGIAKFRQRSGRRNPRFTQQHFRTHLLCTLQVAEISWTAKRILTSPLPGFLLGSLSIPPATPAPLMLTKSGDGESEYVHPRTCP